MKHVRLLVLTEDLPRASLALADTQSFHPDSRPPAETQLDALPGHQYHEVFIQARSRLDKIARLVPPDAPPAISPIRVVDLAELDRLNAWLGGLWDETSGYEEAFRGLDDAERLVREQQAALENFAQLNIDLGMLQSRTRFLDIHVGRVPRENLRQLEGAVGLAKHILHLYMQTDADAHVVIVGPAGEKESALAPVLSAAGFQNLPIPQGLDRPPAELQKELSIRLDEIEEQRRALRKTLDAWAAPHRERLTEARHTLLMAEPLVELDPSLRSAGHLAHLAGWVPARSVGRLERRLRETLGQPFDLSVRDPLPEERSLVPTVPVRSRLLAPFGMLVGQYGIPAYGEVDPTPLFAVTFLLMFGSMFGDLGQGAVIAGAALLFRRKLGRFWLFGLLAGLASMGFGLLYGSVFGYEHVLPALWMSPLSDPLLMLSIALAWGVVFIATACLLAIYNRLAVRNWSGALFGHHGVVNLIFYLALVAGGLGMERGDGFGLHTWVLIAGSLAVLAWHSWRHQEGGLSERILVVFIETLETVIGYVSNTLSFLRVAAFSLNHVALSIAVFSLADMMGAFGHLVTVILGNLFVLVLEGGIVMIQVMRLQYYEGFSRYFSGDGHAFSPLRFRRGLS
ncbi:V-type ATP synthase subunit I [Imhoffiella purpurea]|nr:V-type ATPase 116kDa subunit family protein [Imhoffiella purpurea]